MPKPKPTYYELLQHPEWQKVRLKVMGLGARFELSEQEVVAALRESSIDGYRLSELRTKARERRRGRNA